ncbi:hypothetical protein OEZ85_008978 [Tetradesmus obliquus]|uniref:Pentacotripeptide-repeat region of PRORP domain-containing protein n=1 Tax=Tetradesmus obliquus TaxID=3088 RepID=A0ABY8TP56_TETOB|nr:hypothetical protein OEZ85_008978 [Tetradesmus obliquus]
MRIAHDREDFGHAVSLFNQFLAKGIAAAEAAALPADAAADQQQQEDGEQQQQQEQQRQQQQQLVLPLQYRPDHSTLTLYCRSLVGLADLEERQARLARGADRYQPEQPQQCTVARAEQAVALWGRGSVSNIGFPAYYALIAAYRLAGRHDKAVEVFQALRAANPADALNKHYRLWVAACSAAVRSQNYEAANELARMFSTRQVPFRDIDYRARVGNIYRALVRGAAACGKWEDAIYWLQELINNQSLVPVPPEAFMAVMLPAAAAGRMDVVRVMMGAVDQQLALQGAKPLVYHPEELIFVIKAAGAAGDADLAADAWTRLKHDVQQKPTTASPSLLGLLGPLDKLNSGGVQVQRKPQQPSVAAFKAVVKAYVDCKDFGRALHLVAELEEVYGGTRATSVYGGLSFLPIDELKSEADIAALFMQLKARKDAGQPVSTPMMNVVVRAVGRLGNTESAGKTFEVFGAWGLQPDADSYNAVMESCEASKKFTAIEGLIAYMSSRGVQPNLHSWNLLLSAAAAAQDVAAVESAVQRMLASGMQLLRNNAGKALKLAHEQRSESLLQLLRQANEQQGLGMQPQVFNGYWRRGGSSSSNGGSSAGGRAEVWKPGMPHQQQQQQRQQRVQESRGQDREQGDGRQLQQMLEQQGGGETEERKSLRAGLAAALGAAMNQ